MSWIKLTTIYWLTNFASEALSVFSSPCCRCSGCAKNRGTCCGLVWTELMGCTWLFCDWTLTKAEKCACFYNSFMKHRTTNTTLVAICVTKLRPLRESWGFVVYIGTAQGDRNSPKLVYFLHDRRQLVSLDRTATHWFQSNWESIDWSSSWVCPGPNAV